MSDKWDNYLVAFVLMVMLAVTAVSMLREPEEEVIPIEFNPLLDLTDDEAVEDQIIFYIINRDNDSNIIRIVDPEAIDSLYDINITLLDIVSRGGEYSDVQTMSSDVRWFIVDYIDYNEPKEEISFTGYIDEYKRVHETSGHSIYEIGSSEPTVYIVPVSLNPVSLTIDSSNRFALDLYRRLSETNGNVLFSPYSISTALSMVYEGAKGATADEMESVFYFNNDTGKRLRENEKLYNMLNSLEGIELDTANALWLQEDYPFLEEYVSRLTDYYHGEAEEQDFIGYPEEARLEINEWVENQTNHKITDLFPEGSLNSAVRLVLTNAIYFKGEWVYAFDPNETTRQPFFVSATQNVTVDMMRLKKHLFYAALDDVKILELPYEHSEVSMILLLPMNQTLTQLESKLDYGKLQRWISKLDEYEVTVYLPRFSYESKYFMKETLSEMGMPTAFTPGLANLTGINPDGDLFISKVIHQAFIEVNEEGTEAAAATGVVAELSATLPMYEFRADHPFIYLILDKQTGSILFMGRLIDPST